MSEILAGLSVHANFWIERSGEVVLSRWRVHLLEAIEETGSISSAAEQMSIQYRLAWDRLEEMEHGLGLRLVERQVGGTGGGGARLSPAGRALVTRFNGFVERMDELLAEEFGKQF